MYEVTYDWHCCICASGIGYYDTRLNEVGTNKAICFDCFWSVWNGWGLYTPQTPIDKLYPIKHHPWCYVFIANAIHSAVSREGNRKWTYYSDG